ncbi:MAG: hypothetical protein QXG86_02915 [Candidatus Woesearchaeota archaeon]
MKNKNINKKSQITIFIIIGVVLLFSTALVIYIKNKVGAPEREVKIALEKVPEEIKPAQEFVSQCINYIGIEALKKIGMHGGYISTDQADYDITLVKFKENDENPTEADVVPFTPKSRIKIPYWYYMRSPNDCSECYFSSLQPPLYRINGSNSIESQIDNYINLNLRKCLNNFEPFRKEGFSIKDGGIKTTTYIREKDVYINVDYPVELEKEGNSYKMSKFATIIPVRIKELYETADYITRMAPYSHFLEVSTLNWITAFSGLTPRKLPPLAQFTVSYKEVRWRSSDVRKNLVAMLETYVPAISLSGTIDFKDPRGYTNPLIRGIMASLTLPQNITENINAKFLYLGWPIYLNIGGEELGPQSINFPLFSIFPLKGYSFSYDISYPVIIKITDPYAFRGEGYTFMFALETNIRGNRPFGENYTSLLIKLPEERVSFFCEAEQRNSGIIKVLAYDAATKEPLEDVLVTFLGSQECPIGVTALQEDPTGPFYGEAVLVEKFPVGIGTLVFSKPFYAKKEIQYATYVGKEDTIKVYLEPLKKVKAKLKKISLPPLYSVPHINFAEEIKTMTLPQFDISSPDIGMVLISRNVESNEEPWSYFFFAPSEKETEIMLYPGNYNVSLTLIYNHSLTIPKEKICQRTGLFSKECETLPEQTFEAYIYNSLTYEWEVNSTELYDANSVTFYIISPPLPKSWSELQKIEQSKNIINSQLFYPLYEPKFEK